MSRDGPKVMKIKTIIISIACLSLAGCGKDSPEASPESRATEAVASTEGLPSYDSQGVISGLEGQILTLDHDGASAAGLKPGRDRFVVYADVIAEVPITPGARVSFSFKKTPQGLEIAALRARP